MSKYKPVTKTLDAHHKNGVNENNPTSTKRLRTAAVFLALAALAALAHILSPGSNTWNGLSLLGVILVTVSGILAYLELETNDGN